MTMSQTRVTRRSALKQWAAAGITAPLVMKADATAAPSETLYHASFGAAGMASSIDIRSLTASPHLKLVAVADVDLRNLDRVKARFPGVKVYQDWRELLDKEKNLSSVNVSTPDHMHASITMRAMQQGLHVYTQKPLTQTIHEARQLARVAREKGLVTQMGIQIHSDQIHRSIVATIQAGTIGKVTEVHSWSGKHWGGKNPAPIRTDPIPTGLDWNLWLGVASERPYLAHYYHPGEWRKRVDFGTGTFGDMGCHILDPVFTSLALTAPLSVRSEGGAPTADNRDLDSKRFATLFPGTSYTTGDLSLYWYDGDKRPPDDVKTRIGDRSLTSQGSIYIGTEGILVRPFYRRSRAASGGKVQGGQAAEAGRKRPLSSVRRSLPRQWQNLGAVRLLRPANGIGPAGLPRDPVPRRHAGVGRGEPESNQPPRGERLRPPPLSQGLGNRRALSGPVSP